jgi:hypothetical protein
VLTFKEYLASRKAGYDRIGDFVRLARADAALPEIASESELLAYIYTKQDQVWTIEAGQSVWSDYLRVRNAKRT